MPRRVRRVRRTVRRSPRSYSSLRPARRRVARRSSAGGRTQTVRVVIQAAHPPLSTGLPNTVSRPDGPRF